MLPATCDKLFSYRKTPVFKNQASAANANKELHHVPSHYPSPSPPHSSAQRAVREWEAQGAVTLNDSMNRPGPFRAHCLAVSCFDMGPNTSLALGQRVWVQRPVHEEEHCGVWQLTACRDKSGAFLPGWEGMTVACGSYRAGWMSVTAAHLTLWPSVCLPVILSVTLSGSWLTAVNNVINKCYI